MRKASFDRLPDTDMFIKEEDGDDKTEKERVKIQRPHPSPAKSEPMEMISTPLGSNV